MPTSRPPLHLVLLLLAPALLLGSGCGGGAGGGGGGPPAPTCGSGGGPVITLSGQVEYVRLVLSIAGLGPATETLPARHVDVEVRNAIDGSCYGRTSTDGAGNYSIVTDPPAGATIEVVAYSRTLADATRDIFVHDADPPAFNGHSETNVYFHASPSFVAATSTRDITVPYTGGPANRPSIGFGLLDTLVTCWDGAAAALGKTFERCHAYSRVGNNFILNNTSFYNHTARALAFLGGSAGLPDNSDTDYFDDAVVAHEFMHFIEQLVSHSMSRGGAHIGELLEPNFAWSEGQSTGYGCLLLRDPNYIDTFTTVGSIIFRWNIENVVGFTDKDTIGDEVTVAEILWDLGDGGAGPTDTDADGLNATYAQLFGVFDAMDPATDAPYIGLFLDRIVAATAITSGQMSAYLSGPPEDQQISYPLTGGDVWPTSIGIGGTENGICDGTIWNPCPGRGFFASRWYRLTLAAPQVVTIDLDVQPLAGTPDNLDLFLTPNSNVNLNIASSTNAGDLDESINVSLQAGTYIIRVEANCTANNRANFTLTVN